jgi:hypothetical protein
MNSNEFICREGASSWTVGVNYLDYLITRRPFGQPGNRARSIIYNKRKEKVKEIIDQKEQV